MAARGKSRVTMRFMKIVRRNSVVSTMDECRALFAAGAGEITVVTAEEQTGGRGRVGRAWYSPPGGAIYVSILLTPRIAPRSANQLTMLGALAVLDAVEPELPFGVSAGIKWPNDVLIDGRKLAGVLVETALLGDAIEYCVIGIGVNVDADFANAPVEVRERATSLRGVGVRAPDRERILVRLLASVERRYAELQTRPPFDEYRSRLLTLGTQVTVSGAEQIHGLALRIEDDGALVLQTIDGERRVRFGDLG